MASRVVIYEIPGNPRSESVCKAMREGIRRLGDIVVPRVASEFSGIEGDVALFYGFEERMRRIFSSYRKAERSVVYIDLGYWGRLNGGRFSGYHKVVVNGRHPTPYFQHRKHTPDRFGVFDIEIREWAPGSAILIAGMSDRAAVAAGFAPGEWEKDAIEAIGAMSDRPIIYRPKPSWRGAQPLEGAEYSPREQDVTAALHDCHAVVTHHSNVAIDGLVLGIPAFCWEGVAVPMSLQSLKKIETPAMPDDREQWLHDIAWCQWNVSEMAAGKTWAHLKNEGLIP